ncbi:MAG: M48 family metalloprotease [Candidatus Omnitrophica bacterium]|nr:M48 family metalloprotease [Candidatus Omnitrophota bacterium]
MFFLQVRMWLLISILFSIVYAMVVMVGSAMGIGSFNFYLIFAFVLMFIQYMLGPKIVEWSMKVRYIKREEDPFLYAMVEEQARRAKIPMPKVCISAMPLPNAFAFGRGVRDGRVCVTEAIKQLLDEYELKAVIGHEISHLKNRDVLTITLLSVIPMIMYRLAWHFLFFGGGRRRQGGGNTALIGLAALLFYFVTNLLVLYASRIREYFADRGSIELGNRPEALATALYKLVYGSARVNKEVLKEAEGLKAFFVNDPSRAANEIRDLSQLDLDRSGTIDPYELDVLRNKKIHLSFGDKMMEAMSTHPNMLKRIKHLSEIKN